MRCLTCGVEIEEGRQYCERCAAFAGGAPAPSAQASSSDAVSKIIPYKNVPALIGYYLGVFSLTPCLGFLLALPAVGLGIWGLAKAKAEPNAHGKVHAWVALVLGTLSIVGHIAFIMLTMRS